MLIAGLAWGYNVGAEITDYVIILTSNEAIASFTSIGQLTVGGEVDLSLGPIGRSASGAISISEKVLLINNIYSL